MSKLTLRLALNGFAHWRSVGLCGSADARAAASAQQPKPNILFILADNIGYGDSVSTVAESCVARRRRASIGSPPRACG